MAPTKKMIFFAGSVSCQVCEQAMLQLAGKLIDSHTEVGDGEGTVQGAIQARTATDYGCSLCFRG